MPYGLKFAWLLAGVGTLFVISSFYTKFEPRTFLEATELSPRQFLLSKIKAHYWSLLIVLAPVLTCQLAFYPKSSVFVFPFLLVAFMIISALIITKYASMNPIQKQEVPSKSSTQFLLAELFCLFFFSFPCFSLYVNIRERWGI